MTLVGGDSSRRNHLGGNRVPIPADKPHSADLRRGRLSYPGQTYFITKCVDRALGGILTQTKNADVVIGSLLWARDQGWLRVLGFCIMPDHYHAIVGLRADKTLDSVLASLGKFTARRMNENLGRAGPFWQDGYYEHLVRDRSDFDDILAYVHNNPVLAGLADSADLWAYSTAARFAEEIDWGWLGPSMPVLVRSDYHFDPQRMPPHYR